MVFWKNAVAVLVCTCGAAANASDFGCRVLLCLANPAGPTAVAQCVPPIAQLWRELARVPPAAFPSCEEARPAIAMHGTAWYDPCPAGTGALNNGGFALQQGALDATIPIAGIGEGDNLNPGGGDGAALPGKVCVGQQVGQTQLNIGSGDNSLSVFVVIYDRVAVLDPATSPRVIDVYLNNALYRRVRW